MNKLQLNKLSLLKILFIVWLPITTIIIIIIILCYWYSALPTHFNPHKSNECCHVCNHCQTISQGIKQWKNKKKTKIDKNTELFTIFISIWKNINTTEYWWTCNHNMQSEQQWWQRPLKMHTLIFLSKS